MYDVKKLGERLKSKGLDLGEEAVVIAITEIMDWAIAEALASETPIDDVVAVVLPAVKPYIMAQVDKIDGQDDEGR